MSDNPFASDLYYPYGPYALLSGAYFLDAYDGSQVTIDVSNAGWTLTLAGSVGVDSSGNYVVGPDGVVASSSAAYGTPGRYGAPGIRATLAPARDFNPTAHPPKGDYETRLSATLIVPGVTLHESKPSLGTAGTAYTPPDYAFYARNVVVTGSALFPQTFDYFLVGFLYPGETPFPSGGGTTTTTPPVAAGASLGLDAHGRPLAVLTLGAASSSDAFSPGLTPCHSDDAGHSFRDDAGNAEAGQSAGASLRAGGDPSLLVDARRNTYRIIYDNGSGLSQHFGTLQEGFAAGAGSPAPIAGLTGSHPAAASHPGDPDFALLAYFDGTTLKTAWSGDAGATWEAVATVQAGLDPSAQGRPAVCWLGEAAFLAVSVGPALGVRASPDRGLTWGAPVLVATAAANPNYSASAYSGLSLLGWQGRLYLLAWTYGAAGTTLSPALWICPDLGATWAASPGALPAGLAPPSALGVLPTVAQHRLGVTHHSNDDTAHWLAN